MQSYYRRPLPEGLVPFSSALGREVFAEALAEGGMGAFFALSEQFHTQAEPAFCALGSLVVVLNALSIDPGRFWKGPWRWFSEEMLDCCAPLEVVRERGLTLPQFACLARCNGAEVEWSRAETSSLEAFRAALRAGTKAGSGPFLVVSYSRRALGQTGDGHFSPVGGYCEARDLVLVLDVARFKYPPHWVPLRALWESMLPLDSETGKSRGFALLRAGALPAALLRVAERPADWEAEAVLLARALPEKLQAEPAPSVEDALVQVFRELPPGLRAAWERSSLTTPASLSPEHQALAENLFAELGASPLCERLRPVLRAEWGESLGRWAPEIAALLGMALLPGLLPAFPASLREELAFLAEPSPRAALTKQEVQRLRSQLAALRESSCCAPPLGEESGCGPSCAKG
jgi:glutathione gamma-glutamylcysteinyltransferase